MITLCAPRFGDIDRARVEQVLQSGMLVQGAMVAELERALEGSLGTPAVACQSGTAALHIALQVLGIGPGDEVVVPAFTWPSAAHAVVNVGAKPRFVDIDADTLNLDPDALEAVITPKTKALLPIHQFGIPAPMRAVMRVANTHGLRVIEDAACAIGSVCEDGLAGTIGDVGCFSFHPRKVVTTGEGGAVVSNDPALIDGLRIWRNHGQDPSLGLERFVACGVNYRMPELSAAIGIAQVDRLDAILEHRRRLGRRYIDGLAGISGVSVPGGVQSEGNNFQSFVVDVDAERRDRFMTKLLAAGVQNTIGTYAVAEQPVWRDRGVVADAFPNASAAMRRLVTLPLHEGMNEAAVDTVVEAVRHIAEDS
ncbi:MAG: dTDP-4-amino-4,6-dideoxygalactose transaminase [Bradymonadia bacterium]|jgi:dTDP-4-amino-4,6-dideoxygalactose transaminase